MSDEEETIEEIEEEETTEEVVETEPDHDEDNIPEDE